jgi:ribosome-associated protein
MKTPSKTKKPAPKKKSASTSGKSGARPGGKSAKSAGRKTGKPASKKTKSARPKKAVPSTPPKPAENPEAKKLAHRIAELVLDIKALDVVILDVRGMTSYADYFVVASGESERQVSAMAENVQTHLKAEDHRAIGHEGTETGNWILLDYGEVVAHLFYTEVRSFYDLEGLWADAPREKVA